MYMFMYAHVLQCALQCLMLMEMLFGADGLRQLKGNVAMSARPFQLHLIRLLYVYYNHLTKTSSSCKYLLIITCFEMHGNAPI